MAVKVLHVCTIPLTARTFIASFARYLERHGYDVSIACSAGPDLESGRTMDEMRADGFRMLAVPISRTVRPLADIRATLALTRLIRREQFDVVHTQTTKAGILGRLAARLAGVPVVIHTAHAFPFHAYLPAWRRRLYALVERIAAGWADRIMVDTEAVREEGLRFGVAPAAKILAVPMGIDLQRFTRVAVDPSAVRAGWGIPAGAAVVGTVARLVPDKGLEVFLDAAAQISAARGDVWYLLVGGGPLQDALQTQAARLGIAGRVVFAGVRGDIPDQMAAMDVFVLPTLREGFGVVLAESMAVETPVVTSNLPPLREVVADGETGVLLSPGDVEGVAAAVLDLLGDDDRRAAMGAAGRRRVEQLFDERRIFERMEAEYRALLRAKGVGTAHSHIEPGGA